MREASPHCRRSGRCQSRRPSTKRRTVQIGSWWLTQTASWPRAWSRALSAAASMRVAIKAYGSPQLGRNGLRRCGQFCGRRSAPSPTPKRLPSKTFSLSSSRSSVPTGTPKTSAIGVAVSCARCSGEAITTVTSRPCSAAAASSAICRPSSDSPKLGSRPYSTASGLCTSPWRSRCTVVRVGVMRCPLRSARRRPSQRAAAPRRPGRGRPGRARRRRTTLRTRWAAGRPRG